MCSEQKVIVEDRVGDKVVQNVVTIQVRWFYSLGFYAFLKIIKYNIFLYLPKTSREWLLRDIWRLLEMTIKCVSFTLMAIGNFSSICLID